MTWYVFVQQDGGVEEWRPILAELRSKEIAENAPAFTTILEVDNNFSTKLSMEEMAAVRYRGSLYFDFDSTDLEEVIPAFKRFLRKLQEDHKVELRQLELFASGGKGFHVIVPPECFLPKLTNRGYLGLPKIYAEIANELYVDTLDMRVYSGRRGRQLRTVNVLRPNGKYKVQLSVKEAFSITPELYEELCSTPRPLINPEQPVLNNDLALLFSVAQDKVEKALRNRKKSRVDEKLLKRFNNELPPTVLALMRGEGVGESLGFNNIAQQLAVTACALNKNEDDFVSMCSGLILNHVSDGVRYNTPAKRERELRRMHQYMFENPTWSFSIGGIKSLVAKDVKTPDLDSQGIDIEEEEEADEELDSALLQGMRVNTSGIYRKHEGDLIKVCDMGLGNPRMMLHLKTQEVVGYEVDVYINGTKKGTKHIDMSMFASRAKFQAFTTSAVGANMNANDAQCGALADILRTRATKSGEVVYTLQAEGLDVIVLPDAQVDVIWADRYGVRSRLGMNYRLAGALTTEAEYNSDLAMCPELERNDETRQFFHNLFNINAPEVIAKFLGWYVACFLSQPIRHVFNQFPSLQVYGQAGSGKSKTTELFARMHYFRRKPKINSALALTPFSMEALVSGSASLPFLIDEYKPRAMRTDRADKIKSIIRDNYVSLEMSKGRITGESGSSKLVLQSARNSSPLCTIGEAAEIESAIQERVVSIPMSKASKRGHVDAFGSCVMAGETMSAFGKMIMELSLQVDLKKIASTVDKNRQRVNQLLDNQEGDSDRPVFNMAVILTGLDVAQNVLGRIFGVDEYKDAFDRLRESVTSDTDVMVPRQMAEFAKVLDTMAYLSRLPDQYEDKNQLKPTVDYVLNGTRLEVSLRLAYDKYVRHCRSLHEEVLFDNFRAFQLALDSSSLVLDRRCIGTALKDAPTTVVYAFDIERLSEANVSHFNIDSFRK